MSGLSDIRANPFSGSVSWRVMDPEIHEIAELENLPGIYGFQLKDRPEVESITITENVTGGSTFDIISTGSPLPGQVRISYDYGFCIFNVADNGKEIITNGYNGGGSTANLKHTSEAAGGIFSESEIFTGKYWIDGKKIYRKVIDIGSLPNSTTKNVSHGIISFENITQISGFADDNINFVNLPYTTSALKTIEIKANSTNIVIITNFDFSTYSGYAIIEYTKP